MPDRVIDAPIPPDLDRLEYLAKGGFLFTHKEVLPLLAHVARLEAEKQEAHTEGWNAAIEAAAKECDQFVEAYSFWSPFPEGYVYGDNESRAAALFAKGRFEVAAKLIREAAKPTAAKQGDPS